MARSIDSAGQYYDYGLRARVTKIDRQKLFIDAIGNVEHVHVKDLELFHALVQLENSRTWKERHAKGVPVKITPQQAQSIPVFPLPEQDYYCTGNGHPFITTRDLDNPGKPVIAYFSDFRYKPEWLEKKGHTASSMSDGSIPPRVVKGGSHV